MRSAAILLGVVLLPASAFGQDVDPVDRRIDELLRRFDYTGAAAVIEQALLEEPPPARELALRTRLVEVHASADDPEAAREAALRLYERDPGHPVPGAREMPPQVREHFVAASEAAQDHEPRQARVRVEPTDVGVRLEIVPFGRGIVDRFELWLDEGSGFAPHLADRTIRGFEIESAASPLRFYGRGSAPSGRVTAVLGSESDPMRYSAPTPRDDDVEEDHDGGVGLGWWIAGGSVLAAAIVVVILVAVRPWEEQPTIDDPIVFP